VYCKDLRIDGEDWELEDARGFIRQNESRIRRMRFRIHDMLSGYTILTIFIGFSISLEHFSEYHAMHE